jgi:HEAT repeat protein
MEDCRAVLSNLGARVLLVVTPLRLTLWVLAVAGAAVLALLGLVIARHLEWGRAERARERVRGMLEPVFSRFLETQDPHIAEELRPAFLRMDATERPIAALLAIKVLAEASPDQREQLRDMLEDAGIVELGERGTRRLSPWRRALACEALGKIGSRRSVPALLARLEDRRPEVRMAAVRALGDIGSVDAVPALRDAFLESRVAPTSILMDALRRIGGEARTAFERGFASTDSIVRIASCYGLSGIRDARDEAVPRLGEVLASDSDAQVRAAAASSLGIVGGSDAPRPLLRATVDPDVLVRRAAVKALGAFDDPTTGETLDERTEDEDREVAIRAAEALLALTHRPRAASQARARVESSSAWAVEYARKVAEVSA